VRAIPSPTGSEPLIIKSAKVDAVAQFLPDPQEPMMPGETKTIDE
jgi:hypothetical protein